MVPATEQRFFDKTSVGNVQVITLTQECIRDEQYIWMLADALYKVVESGGVNILVDFKNVTYFSAAALGKFITLHQKTAKAAGKLVLCIQDNKIRAVFEISQVNKLICIRCDGESALEAFTEKDS